MAVNKLKDERLWEMSHVHNVAQFVSFGSGDEPAVRYSRVRDYEFSNGSSLQSVIEYVLKRWNASANIRSFMPGQEQGNPFYYGLTDAQEIERTIRDLAKAGYSTILNETIDVADGGVSGVLHGSVIEFSPEDTPRAVEKPGIVSLRSDWGLKILERVYGFSPQLPPHSENRYEFSVHPKRVGYRYSHTLIWEATENLTPPHGAAQVIWPNNFSRFIGDKAFGLLLADVIGIQVPRATVFSRSIAPFSIGRPTGTREFWLRTCPRVKRPGKYSTFFGWVDPFALMATEDPQGDNLASVLVQESVDAQFSGATAVRKGKDLVQGVAGYGDEFMLGKAAPQTLPEHVERDVRNLVAEIAEAIGHPVQIEWVHDGSRAWVVQLSLDRSTQSYGVLIRGTSVRGWLSFDPADGLDELERVIAQAKDEGKGISLVRPVGQTSHVGDLIRASDLPARYVGD